MNDVARVANQHTTVTTIADLQNIAIEFYKARAAIISETIGNLPERGRRLVALIQQFEQRGECNGVRVEAIMPQNRMVYRRLHFRFRYTVAGKQVNEASARTRVEG